MSNREEKHKETNEDWFIKFPSIDNHYQQGVINRWSVRYPELPLSKFIVSEKLDGSNMQVCITADDIKFASRNRTLGDDESFFDYHSVLLNNSATHQILKDFQEHLKHQPDIDNIYIYGEIYGVGVQKRIDYGDNKDFKAFEMRINGDLISIGEALDLMDYLNITRDFWVPILGIFDTFAEAYAFETAVIGEDGEAVAIDTTIAIGNLGDGSYRGIEGVVIAPYDRVFAYDNLEGGQSVFRMKKKNKEFNDKMSVKTKVVEIFEGSDEYKELHAVWAGYFNDNRLQDLFSKEGKIETPQQIGKYIPLMMNDVKEDFFKEHKDAFIALTDKERKKIISSSAGYTLPLLQKHM